MAPKQQKKKKVQVVASVVKAKVMRVEVEVNSNKAGAGDELKETPLQSQETQEAAAAAEKKKKKEKRAGGGHGRSKKRRGGGALEYGGYKRYVWRVLKQVHPDMGASARTMDVLDMMMADMFERLADEASRLSKLSGRLTLTSREVQSAVRLVLPGDLANHAISEGTKAISNYLS
uniref:Core Histone H2A/H2B/H3 domain-containing protein n=1 Tax=Oryza punctata TaxID=4537 RepID=A0A0E0M4S6_ORYPU